MKVFGYGSLMNEVSLRKTIPHAHILGTDELVGYRRVFNLKSSHRINPITGQHSSVLNVEPDLDTIMFGLVIEVPKNDSAALLKRECGYDLHTVELASGETVSIFMKAGHKPHPYLENDLLQTEYLNICLEGAKTIGEAFYNNFLDSTFLLGTTLRKYLAQQR
jgi:hypothetical protein